MDDNRPVLRRHGVSKAFGALRVREDLHLEILPAQKVALIGPSGSGNSTILCICMTLEAIDARRVESAPASPSGP